MTITMINIPDVIIPAEIFSSVEYSLLFNKIYYQAAKSVNKFVSKYVLMKHG